MEQTLPKILIIEDEQPVSAALEHRLNTSGFVTTVARDGAEGLELLDKETYALILLDLMLPKVDGFKVLEALHEKGIKTPVMVLSNLGQIEDEIRARKLGAVDFFVKSNTPIFAIAKRVKEKLGISTEGDE